MGKIHLAVPRESPAVSFRTMCRYPIVAARANF